MKADLHAPAYFAYAGAHGNEDHALAEEQQDELCTAEAFGGCGGAAVVTVPCMGSCGGVGKCGRTGNAVDKAATIHGG